MSLTKNVRLLTLFNFFTDLKLYGPIAILYFTQVTGSFSLGMSIFSLVFLSSALFEVPTGILSDLIGRKNTLVLGAIASVFCTMFYAFGGSYWILVIGALCEGISRSFYSGNNDALLYDSVADANKEIDYQKYLARVSSMFQIALALSAAIGSVLAAVSFPLVMWLSVIPQMICLMISLKVVDPKKHTASGNIYLHLKESFYYFRTKPKLRRLSLASMLTFGIGESSFDFLAAFHATVWPVWAIGFAKMGNYMFGALSFTYAPKLIQKFGALQLMITKQFYNRIIQTFALLFPTVASPLLISSSSLLYGVERVAESSLLQREFTDKQRATMGSLNAFGGSVIFGIFAFILGNIADTFGPAKALLFSQFCYLPILWIYWNMRKEQKEVK